MRKILNWTLALSLATLAWAATPAKKKAPLKAAKKTGTQSSAARSGKKAPVKGTTWRNRQMVPTPERYREIQDALAAKGYLNSGSGSGAWDQNSVEALKRFQTDQNIDSTGKINSLSLIALGLGPKHGAPPPEPDASRQ